jgi:hypothetical protein
LPVRAGNGCFASVQNQHLISAVLFVLILLVILLVGFFASVRSKKNLSALGQKLGLLLETKGRFFKEYSLTGTLKGRRFSVFSYTTGSGKSKQRWAAAAVELTTRNCPSFKLGRRLPFLDFFAKFVRKNEAKTGDAAFDEKWVLTAPQPERVQIFLLPELRQKIAGLLERGPSAATLSLEAGRLLYSEQGSFSSTAVCDRIARVADLLEELAAAVEIASEL